MKQKLLIFELKKELVAEFHNRMMLPESIKVWFGIQYYGDNIQNPVTANYWSYAGGFLLAINEEPFNYQIEAFNAIMKLTNLYLHKNTVRRMLVNDDLISEFNISEYRKYGEFKYITMSHEITIPQIKPL